VTRAMSVLGFALVVAGAAGRSQQPGSLFRYIRLSPTDTIALGKQFVALSFAEKIAEHTYQLKPGTFGGAERIRIITDSAGRVTRMEFEYADDKRFAPMLKEYVAWLGKPTANDSTARRRVVAWQDSVTRFELTAVTVGDRQIMSTKMIDVTPKR
jgi:hypothetical protein